MLTSYFWEEGLWVTYFCLCALLSFPILFMLEMH